MKGNTDLVQLYTDGSCPRNIETCIQLMPMLAIVTDVKGNLLSKAFYSGGTSNIAELLAVRDALKWASGNNVSELHIHTDSRNTLAWVAGRIGMKIADRPQVIGIHKEIVDLRRTINMTIEWVPRERNIAGIYIERREEQLWKEYTEPPTKKKYLVVDFKLPEDHWQFVIRGYYDSGVVYRIPYAIQER